jgi:uncharacterized membrane protein
LSTEVISERQRSLSSVAFAVLLAASTILVGLMAGFFYAYACSVMVGLDRVDDRTFIVTMQWINATVRNAAFAPAFFGSLVLTIAAAVVALVSGHSARGWIVAATVLYAAAFLVTLTLNVPLNEQLAAAGPADQISDPAAVRAAFEGPWVRWNLLRTGLTLGSLIALSIALLATTSQRSEPSDTAEPASGAIKHVAVHRLERVARR